MLGVNDRAQLARANAVIMERIRQDLMRSGVTLLDPPSTFIYPEARVEPDVVIHPGCHLLGNTVIASGCEIGPNAYVVDSEIGEDSRVWYSVLEESRVGRRVSIGPFSHLRAGALIEDDVHLGNYAEVKGSRIGSHTQMHHFSYMGDADVGEYVNIAAGVITANYDGKQKHHTVIGDHAFIGTDTTLRAPITVGPGATTGAGAVATHDIPAGEVWVGVPARPLRSAPSATTEAESPPPDPDG
jgi:bifunctional UDP-N-acetylglucosamine pyrophosphorylase/glucosamine-1-phosphate N-acetyltransferase